MDLYSRLPDKNIIFKINELFYEKVYDHPWMKLFFAHIDQEFITSQQTDFIIGAIGGPNKYTGRMPSNAHPHMMISEELMDLRERLLEDAMNELNTPQELKDTWIRIDESFRRTIVKSSVKDCEKRFFTDDILDFDNPIIIKKAG